MTQIARTRRSGLSELAAAAALGVTVFCMVLGSSSVAEVVGPGRKLRWIALFALAVVAVALAVEDIFFRRARPGRRLLVVLACGTWFAAITLVSATWSVDPRLSFGRAGSLALLLLAAGGIAVAVQSRPTLAPRLLTGALAAAAAVSVAGLVVLAFSHDSAVQAATAQSPARFRGLGQNPDTVAMLAGLAFPVSLWALDRARNAWERVAGGVALALFVGTIAASGSRGGIVAAFAGGLVFAFVHPSPVRRRLSIALAVAVTMTAATAATTIPKPLKNAPVTTSAPAPTGTPTPHLPSPGTPVGASETQYAGRLSDELYRVQEGPRSLFQSSGRLAAWRGAIEQADARPLLGYGFGTENKVFVDRFYNFQGQYVENSFVGLYLQLGAIGLGVFVVLLSSVCLAAVRAVRSARTGGVEPALTAVLASGIVLMLVQSYVYSVGNVATVAFWVASFAVAGYAAGEGRRDAIA